MSFASSRKLDLSVRVSFFRGSYQLPLFVFYPLGLTIIAVAATQFFAPAFYTTSPLWGLLAVMLLTVCRGTMASSEVQFSVARLFLFVLLHAALVFWGRHFSVFPSLSDGHPFHSGWLNAGFKLVTLFPALVLLPVSSWLKFIKLYKHEFIAGLIVTLTYFPLRILDSVWPWYGQLLGHAVFHVSAVLVSGLNYVPDLTPMITGRHLDVIILKTCSGINGVELFDYLFGFLVICDWNRLRKGRTMLAYFAGIVAMLLSNILRIASFVVFGNRGFASLVMQFHLSAGWIFFAGVFLLYLIFLYRWLLLPNRPAG